MMLNLFNSDIIITDNRNDPAVLSAGPLLYKKGESL